MAAKHIIFFICLVAFVCGHVAFAYDNSALQDFCIADFNSSVRANGVACKNPMEVQASDFFYSGKTIVVAPKNSSTGSLVIPVNMVQLPGLNTLGISMARLYYGPGGINPPHIHPRASEVLTVTEGSLFVGFATSNPENRLISKILEKGDVFVFPAGLVHFEQSIGDGYSAAWASFNSQNLGAITISKTVFGSKPLISNDILAKAFQVDKTIVDMIQMKF